MEAFGKAREQSLVTINMTTATSDAIRQEIDSAGVRLWPRLQERVTKAC